MHRVGSATRAVQGRRSLPSFALAAFAFACSALPAQAPPGTPPTPPAGGTHEPAVTPPPAPAATPAATLTFGRIVVEQAALRCWSGAVAQPPVFEEVLAKDQVVAIGRSENGLRAVQLPLGPAGFVSKKFTETTPEGRVKTKGAKVAFRYRPRSSEAPVTQLENGTELHVIGEQDDWYRVRVPGVDAWVAEAEVAAIDPADPAPAKAYEELRAKHEGEVKARLDAIAAQLARAQQDKADLAGVQMVEDALAGELKKPLGEQQFAPLLEALDKLSATLAPESAGKPAIEALKKRIDTQRWIVEATVVRDSKPPIVDGPPPEKKDPLEAFQAIGWLRYERRLAGPGVYFLEKGGQRQFTLSCNTGRYDLGLFVDQEIAVIGPRRKPGQEGLSVLDVERLKVVGVATK